MNNLMDIFRGYEQDYHDWLKKKAIPWTTQKYGEYGIDKKFQNIQTGLLGQPVWDPSGTKRVGGSLETAGGVVKDYFTRPNVRTMHPTEGVIQGEKLMSPADRHISAVGEKGINILSDVVHWGVDKLNEQHAIMFPNSNQNISTKDKRNNIANSPEYTDEILRKKGLTQQDGFSLSKWAGVNMDDVKKNWKDKGGFEGLMSNPAFTLGLALMQSSAQGKTIGEDLMNNFIKGAKLSDHYKDRLEAKAGDVIQATEGQMENIETVLEGMNIKKPFFSKVLKGNQAAQWEEAVESIANEVETRVRKMKKAAGTKDVVVNTTLKKKIIKQMEADGFFKRRKGAFGVSDTLYMEGKAEGGPVKAGQPYVVGEKGPEVVIPKADANVVSNDDSQVMGMLLASNPQLQNVSKARAESILRSRFPDYFA